MCAVSLLHMILSHHGSLEYGSPKVPVFLEAMLLHQLDTMDAKMECMRASIEKDRQIDGVWTSYIAPLERSVLKKRRYLEPPAAAEPSSRHASHAGTPNPSATPAAKSSAPPRPVSTSPFASKLQEALHHEK